MIDTNQLPQPLRIRVFGRFEVMIDGMPLKPNRPNDLNALAYLVLHHDIPIDRTTVATSCWKTDRPLVFDENPRQYLTKAVYELRIRLNRYYEWLRKPTAQSLLFDSTGVDLDLLDWEAALAAGSVEALDQAAHYLTDATLLEGWEDEWVLEARARFRREYLSRIRDAVLRAGDRADWKSAIQCCTLARDLEPLDQYILCDLLKLLGKRRQFTRMSRVYVEFLERSVRAQIDVDPETRGLYRSLQTEADLFRSTVENGWRPTPISTFIPRPDDLAEICNLIHTCRLTTLTGPGGVGKTRLSIAAVERLNDEFYHRAWFVDLSEVSDPDAISLKLSLCLRVSARAGQGLVEALLSFLQHKECLLILDNCEHLIDGCAATAARILESCRQIRILATSREPLDIVGETVWRVPSLPAPAPGEPITPGSLLDFGSVQLLTERASHPQAPLTIDDQNADAVGRICRRLDGIPLALELAAVQIGRNHFSPQQVADSLDDSLGFLSEGSRTAPPRHQTLRAAIAWSYDLLDEAEKAIFERLSIFAGGFTEEAVKQVCSNGSICSDRAAEALCALVDKSLVEARNTQDDLRRYRLLHTIHEYATERLSAFSRMAGGLTKQSESDPRSPQQRHLDYFVALVESAAQHLSGPEQVQLLDRLSDEHENVCAALAWAYDCAEFDLGLRLSGAVAWFWNTRDRRKIGARWLERFLEKTQTDRSEYRVTALHWAGNIAYGQADFARAHDLYTEALELRIEFGPLSIATGQAALANALVGLGEYDAARERFEASLPVFREAEDWRSVALTLMNMGKLAYQCGDHKRAAELHSESLPLFRQVQDIENESVATNNLIDALITVGDFEAARRMLPDSLTLSVKLKSERRLANCLLNCLMLSRRECDWERGALIHGFESELRRRIEYELPEESRAAYEADCETIRNNLPDKRFRDLVAKGESMPQSALVHSLDPT